MQQFQRSRLRDVAESVLELAFRLNGLLIDIVSWISNVALLQDQLHAAYALLLSIEER